MLDDNITLTELVPHGSTKIQTANVGYHSAKHQGRYTINI